MLEVLNNYDLNSSNDGIIVLVLIFFVGCSQSSENVIINQHIPPFSNSSSIVENSSESLSKEVTADENKSSVRMYSFPGDTLDDLPSEETSLIKRNADLVFQDRYREENGQEYGKFKLRLPQFDTNESFGIRYVNEFFVNKLDELKQTRNELFEMYKESSSLLYYVNYKTFYTFSNDKYISVICIHDGYSGGIRSWNIPETYNFDVTTGRRIGLEDIFKNNENEYKDIIEDILYEYLKDQEDYNENYKELFYTGALKNELKSENFFLGEKALSVFYPIYSIASGCAGNIFFEIPYELLRN